MPPSVGIAMGQYDPIVITMEQDCKHYFLALRVETAMPVGFRKRQTPLLKALMCLQWNAVTGEKSTWVKVRLSQLEKEVFERAATLEGVSMRGIPARR